ncbi:MAG TPA: bifunctional folylpolyglutamate synthase/dihydrofolate synthase, partial [Armatimonadetes bacterium]|nr:bifunctional folylpolyglutamate synthase/dihydrofolate synthase [Armatimonadota bacterium]
MEPSLPAESYLRTRMKFGIKLGLERIKRMLALAGNPQDAFQSVLIAGTNGKGSVAHLMARILFEAGHRVGLYTSPHLVSYRERMRINGCAIDMDSFNSLLSWAREIAERIERDEGLDPPTEFELLTLMACQHFANNGVEFAIMEVGLGGRFDATNALTPVLSIVTTVSLDHTDRLGSTHFDIATEKLGITRPGVPLVTGERKPAILDYIQRHCIAHGISMRVVGIDVRWQKRWARYDGVCADYVTWCAEYPELECALGGDFQFANVGCALGAVEILRECGIAVSTDAIYRGVARARCVGRLDVLQQKPVVVADGAHNPAAATSLSRALRTLFT